MKNLLFIRLDADNVGNKIELALIEKKWSDAQDIHNSVQLAILKIVEFIKTIDYSEFLLIGCDDVFFSINKKVFNLEILTTISEIFFNYSQSTLSFGVANSPEDAILNLRKAKLSGKNQIVGLV